MGRGRSRLVLVFALILGLVTAGLVWNYTQRLQREAKETAEKGQLKIEVAPVVVAAQDIPVRMQIGADMVQLKQIPVQARHAQAFGDMRDVVGKVTKLPISAGEQVIATKFATGRAEAGLTFIIPPGKRAVSVSVSEVIGSGGLILPGDFVDIIGIFDAKTMGKDMAAFILQDIEVLAVAQLLQGDAVPEQGVAQRAEKAAGTPLSSGPKATPEPAKEEPKAQPQARSVTMAVSPEQAQRLVLAENMGKLRLVLRPIKDPNLVSLPEATLGTIRSPVQADAAIITAVNMSPTNTRAGDTIKVEIAVKNTSTVPLQTQGPGPEFIYVQGQTFYSQNFPAQDGKYRVAIGFDGTSSAPLPYRWGLGAELPPGASTSVTGFIKLTHDVKPTNFWAALIREPSTVIQNNVGTTLVTVAPTNVAVISVDVANVRSGPTIDASVIAQLNYGTEVPILAQEKDWYRVKLPDGREGFVAAGWIVGATRGG